MMMRDAEDARRRKKTTRFYDPAGRSAGSAITETEEEDTADSTVLRDAWGRPTGVTLPDADAYQRVTDARAEMVHEKSEAWRGRNVVEGNDLVCKSLRQGDALAPTTDAAEGEARKRAAWQQMMREKADAWRQGLT